MANVSHFRPRELIVQETDALDFRIAVGEATDKPQTSTFPASSCTANWYTWHRHASDTLHIMGCSGSRKVVVKHHFMVNERKPGQGRNALKDFKTLRLTDSVVDQFFDKYNEMDADGTGHVDVEKFNQYFKMDRTPFSDRVFTIVDENKNGEIDFREFVLACWNYCSLDARALARFTFNLYDISNKRVLTSDEIRQMVAEVYGDQYESQTHLRKIIKDAVDVKGSFASTPGQLTLSEFEGFSKKHAMLLFPAFKMQQQMRAKVLGENYWTEQLKMRMVAMLNMETSIYQVLDDMESLEKSRVEGVSAAIGGGPPIARKGGPKGAGAPAGGPAAGNSAAAQPIVKPGGPVTAARLSGGAAPRGGARP